MKLNRKQRIYSILTVLPLVPFLLILALINHICYFLADYYFKIAFQFRKVFEKLQDLVPEERVAELIMKNDL